MTRRERAIETAARARFVHSDNEAARRVSEHAWDAAFPFGPGWIVDEISDMSAAITEYERVMGEGEGS